MLPLTGLAVLSGPATAAEAWSPDEQRTLLSLPKGSSPAPSAVDWDDDGDEDLLVGFRSATDHGGIAVALRQDDGSLGSLNSAFASGSFTTATGWSVYARPVAADWDGDGYLDLIFGTYNAAKGVMFCAGAPSEGAPEIHAQDCQRLRTVSGQAVGGDRWPAGVRLT